MEKLTYKEVQEKYPEAWARLPEPYQNDSCLEFYIVEGDLFCAPEDGESAFLAIGSGCGIMENGYEKWIY